MTGYAVPCALCGVLVPTMTARPQARLCGTDHCREETTRRRREKEEPQ